MPYRADVLALEARVATLERELEAADVAARDGARLRSELTALGAQLRELRRHRGQRAAVGAPISRRRNGTVVAAGLVFGTAGAVSLLCAAMARSHGRTADAPEAVTWPPAPAACLSALPSGKAPDKASLPAQFDGLRTFAASLDAVERDPPPARTSDGWGSPTLTISASPRVTAHSPIDLKATWSNSTYRPVAILEKPEHRRRDAAYALFVRDEESGRSYRLSDSDTSDYCGTGNTYRADDVLHLSPGARADVDAHTSSDAPLGRLVVPTPGVYTIWLAYQFCGYGGYAGRASHDVDDPDFFVGVAVSNGVRVEVTSS